MTGVEVVWSAGRIERFHPLRHGPLHVIADGDGTVADTLRSGSYFEIGLQEPLKLNRVYRDNGDPLGRYWSRVRPSGPTQAMFDLAIDPDWGNKATRWVEITVPAGEVIYDGYASEVYLRRFDTGMDVGKLLGGGSQVYLPSGAIESWLSGGEVAFQ